MKIVRPTCCGIDVHKSVLVATIASTGEDGVTSYEQRGFSTLRRFTGMEMKNLQSYLNWYVYLFRVRQAGERWPEIARVVRHLLMVDARFRSST